MVSDFGDDAEYQTSMSLTESARLRKGGIRKAFRFVSCGIGKIQRPIPYYIRLVF